MRLTLIREGSLLYSVRLNLKLIQQHPHRKTQNNICPKCLSSPWPRQVDTQEEPSHQASDLGSASWRAMWVWMIASLPVSLYIQWVALSGSTTAFTPRPGRSSSPQSESRFCPTLGLRPRASAALELTLHGLRLQQVPIVVWDSVCPILLTPFLFLTLSKTLVLLSQCPLPRGPGWCRC